jgi:tyrosine decarboxylase / aspartate 1-decarboxylase
MVLEKDSLQLLPKALAKLEQSFSQFPEFNTKVDLAAMEQVLMTVADKMHDNYPYAHPLYAGQMLKPPHPMARLAYCLAMWVNPNNHALDGGRASSAMEKQAVAKIAEMFGWSEFLGHLTSGGTMANLEALWVADKLHPGKLIVASEQAHYTHSRITEVLKIPYQSVPVNQHAQMDVQALKTILQNNEVGTVVVTLGTTGVGAVDPLAEILALQKQYNFRVHVDAAYGGYYRLLADSNDDLGVNASSAFRAIEQVDSIVIDPHKCGLQPYGCGCVLFKDPAVGSIYKHDSPYTYFSSKELHLGEISLECSRAGASAVALWATQELLPMTSQGEFANGLRSSRQAALRLYQHFKNCNDHLVLLKPELDILVWAPKAASASEMSKLSQALFDACAELELHLAVIKLPASLLAQHWPELNYDEQQVVCLRSCLLKAEHNDWLEEIIKRYEQAYQQVIS